MNIRSTNKKVQAVLDRMY